MRRRDVLKLFAMSPFGGLVLKAKEAVPSKYKHWTKVTSTTVMKSGVFESHELHEEAGRGKWAMRIAYDAILFAGESPDALYHVLGVERHGDDIYLFTGGPEWDVMSDTSVETAWHCRSATADLNRLGIRFRCQLERAFGADIYNRALAMGMWDVEEVRRLEQLNPAQS